MKLPQVIRNHWPSGAEPVAQYLQMLRDTLLAGFFSQHDTEGRHGAITATDLELHPDYEDRGEKPTRVRVRSFRDDIAEVGATQRRGGALIEVDSEIASQSYRGHVALQSHRGLHIVSQPRTRKARATALSIPNAAYTVVTYDAETFVSETGLFPVDGNGNVTLPEIGGYLVLATVDWQANATGERIIRLMQGGTTATTGTIRGGVRQGAGATQLVSHGAMAIINVTSLPSTVRMDVFQDSGGALNLDPNEEGSFLDIVRVW